MRPFAISATPGPGLASVVRWTAVSALFAALCSGCLVTDPIDFREEPNFPPSFISAPNAPAINTVIRYTRAALMTTPLTLRVRVRDENVLQPLQVQRRIRGMNMPTPNFEPIDVAPTGEPIRDVQVFVPVSELVASCSLLELAVSASFISGTNSGFANRRQEDIDDVAFASWQLWEVQTPNPEAAELGAVAKECPDVTDLTSPTPVGASNSMGMPEGLP
jgi:hypothetical protein